MGAQANCGEVMFVYQDAAETDVQMSTQSTAVASTLVSEKSVMTLIQVDSDKC